jgi:hypothetical protein
MAKDDFFDQIGDMLDPLELIDIDGDKVHDIEDVLIADDLLNEEDDELDSDDDYDDDIKDDYDDDDEY